MNWWSGRRGTVLRRTGIALGSVVLLLAVAIGAFFLVRNPPVEPFEPVAWDPPDGFSVDSGRIDSATAGTLRPLGRQSFNGPEDIAVDGSQRVYTGTRDGLIMRTEPGRDRAEVFAKVGGRPLGLAFDHHGRLLVANHGVGLQSVSPSGNVTLLADRANGEPILAANDLVIDSAGIVYFSDSNSKYNSATLGGLPSYSLYDFLEGRPLGRLLKYDPQSRRTTELLTDLYFPNGVVLTGDERAVLVAESTRYRISRYWLSGSRAGTADVLVDGLPGISDGFTSTGDGRLLLPMYERIPSLDRYVLPSRLMRQAVVRVPTSVLVGEEPLSGCVLVLSEDGRVLSQVTGIHPAPTNIVPYQQGWLLGSLVGQPIRWIADPGHSG